MNKLKDLLWLPVIALVVWLAIKWYRAPAFSQGAGVPDFTGYLVDGDSIRLSDFEGQLILLDFWGSWCGSCRKHNKSLIKIYDQYKDAKFQNETKFDIISIGIETRKKNWLVAIEKDKLIWPNHVSDINRLNDHVAVLYGVKEIPTTYLIDGNRNILGVNLTEEELNQVLSLRLKK